MRLQDITPVVLTYNEEANIGRTLKRLQWAKRVVVVDAYSTDRTHEIVTGFDNTLLVTQVLPHHADKWHFAIHETEIATEWVLRLDADYIVPEQFVDELRGLDPPADVDAYRAHIQYCVYGKPLRGSLYPPNYVLLRRERVTLRRDGHSERYDIDGEVRFLKSRLQHDDRKSIWRWLESQQQYQRFERDKLLGPGGNKRMVDKLRRLRVVAPAAVFADLTLRRGLMLDGKAGMMYVAQRVAAELILSLYLLEADANAIAGETEEPQNPEV